MTTTNHSHFLIIGYDSGLLLSTDPRGLNATEVSTIITMFSVAVAIVHFS